MEKGSPLGLGMFSRMWDLATLTGTIRGDWLLDMLRGDKLVAHFQPIVSTAEPSEVFASECLLRGL